MTGIDFKTAIDWKTQQVEAHCAVEADLRSKPSYLVVTRDYIVKMRSKAEAIAAFPQIDGGQETHSMMPPPEPLIVIPVHMMVSVFVAEGSRPSFGIEMWWRSSTCRAAYCSAQAYFSLPEARSEMLHIIVAQLKAKNIEFPEASLVPLEVEAQIVGIFGKEEPDFKTCKPEIFPVVRRTSVREDVYSKDKPRKSQDVSSWYLALGRNSCYLAEVGPGLPVDVKYQTFGLVTLDSFRANWTFHEERFVLTFREPFKPAVRLELASRYYRQIVITFMKADRFLKPCWPTTMQTMETFHISGLTDPQLLIPGDNYGGLKRTLGAFLSAYHSPQVEWEINWKTDLAPEFRLLPPKAGGNYTNLQLLAVMRSLRYNGYFNSISFNGIDLSGLWDRTDPAGRTPVPYINRSCLALSEVELGQMKFGTLLHQEIHALAFCSETIRQIDFTRCFTERNVQRNMSSSTVTNLGFLFPILNLLELGLTKCNRLLLSGNYLRSADIDGLALMTQNVTIQALDISNCGLSDLALRDIFEVLYHQGHSLQSLDISGNRGRIHASFIANFSQSIQDLRKLNVSGVVMGDIPGPIFSFETLSRFEHLEELDLSKLNLNDASLNALERFLSQKPLPSEPQFFDTQDSSSAATSTLRKLALNNCGINGREAARLVRALANHPSAHLHLTGNPLDDGVEDLCRALSLTPGPAGLHIDMVEFRREESFVALMKALALNKHIIFLSMAGTAPTPLADGPCGPEVCEALETFFRGNTSVKYLDLSGYSGKLDEGQLARGFARSLRGLAHNRTLTHLRIRNQNLHDDVGTLGSVIRQTNTLRMLDCQDNSWNLTSIQFLVKSLKLNSSIVDFPFPHAEYERVWSRVAADVRR
ncbi:RNI-like protein, partial [Cryphonectria parasitica EP155]